MVLLAPLVSDMQEDWTGLGWAGLDWTGLDLVTLGSWRCETRPTLPLIL